MAETIITVHGEFQIHHPAERGTVRFTIGFESARREDVVSSTSRALEQVSSDLLAMHDATAGPVTWWSSDQVRVWGARPWNQDGKQLPVVYHGAVDVEAKFSDLERLSSWVGEVSLRDGISIGGIAWTLTEAKRQSLTQEARRRAVENAVAKATVYATSLGLTTVRPIALSDPGMLGDGVTPPSGSASVAFARSAPSGDTSLVLKPEDITIDVEVHARFAAS